MALFPPQSGQVIRYAYLWWNEARVAGAAQLDAPPTLLVDRERLSVFICGLFIGILGPGISFSH